MPASTAPRVVGVCLGTMEFGRYASEEAAHRMVSAFLSAGFSELDTASMYCAGETERIIGRFPAVTRSAIRLHSKANPWHTDEQRRGLTRNSVLTQCRTSLASLQLTPNPTQPPLDIYYLHAPDHATPLLETLQAVDELHKEGAFSRLGLSNYSSWQVMEVHHLCLQHGFVLPTAYQGMYNALTRGVEPELLACLRSLNVAFYAYNPLAGGILSGKYRFDQPPSTPGRFAGNEWAERYRARFWKRSIFDAIERVQAALKQAATASGDGATAQSVSLADASLRWLRHHSAMSGERGDCIIVGASSEAHVEANLKGVQGGPLDAAVVQAFDDAWQECRADCPPYFR